MNANTYVYELSKFVDYVKENNTPINQATLEHILLDYFENRGRKIDSYREAVVKWLTKGGTIRLRNICGIASLDYGGSLIDIFDKLSLKDG